MSQWRLTDTGIGAAAWNMALDEALLDSFIENNGVPLLRFYKWQYPTLSIGKNQDIKEINGEECKKPGIRIVRRPTGGKAVLHQGELTYSFISGKNYGMPEKVFESYILISKAIVKGLEGIRSGLKFNLGEEPARAYIKNSNCFAGATVTDLSYNGFKVVGSAQLRRGTALLQHGSVLINQDFNLLEKVFFNTSLNQINLKDILGFEPGYEQVKNAIIRGFCEEFGIDFSTAGINEKEKKLAEAYLYRYKEL